MRPRCQSGAERRIHRAITKLAAASSTLPARKGSLSSQSNRKHFPVIFDRPKAAITCACDVRLVAVAKT
jgi:hypothetical protein